MPILAALFFASGFAALVYQVLWVRELGLLFGSTAQAAALAIAVFFAGIAAGGWFWGRRARRLASGLAAFGWLEVAVAATALGHFVLLDAYQALYPALYPVIGDVPIADTLFKILLAALILFPVSFLMGGTLPVLGQYLIRQPAELGRLGSLLYAVNTGGAAFGALAAGFVLPVWLGFAGAYGVAVLLDLTVGLLALWLARRWVEAAPRPVEQDALKAPGREPGRASSLLWALAFTSGLVAIAVEVVWTRMFAQVLQNSVYTYALVLVVFLLALTLGATLANRLSRVRRLAADRIILGLLATAAVLVAASAWLFQAATGGLGYIGAGRDWWEYLTSVITVAAVVMLVPGIMLGTVLPYLLRLLESSTASTGEIIGRLVATNTVGAIAGALIAGFVLLPLVGPAGSLMILSAVYLLVMAGFMVLREQGGGRALALAPAALALAFLFAPTDWVTRVYLNPGHGERLVELREGSHAAAAVIERDDHLLIRVNNHYTLGGTGALESERNQALIPMMLHPDPRDVFFLGMGTGITAGASLLFPVERVVVCEILPEVVHLATAHFGPWTEGLFEDERVTIHAEDGRNCLRRSRQTFDVIISDLFTPWKAGTGNLYTLEHFHTAAARLNEGGLFVQWVPTYQVSEKEFGILARTMDEAFDQVVLWRGDLFPDQSIVALVGQNRAEPLDPQVPIAHGRALAGNPDLPDDLLAAVNLRFYAGNITASGLFDEAAINTDRRPLIEYQAPRTQRAVQAGLARWLTGDQLGLLYERLIQNPGLDHDPYLARLDAAQRDYVLAGRSYFHYGVYRRAGREEEAEMLLADFIARTPFERAPPEPEQPETLSGWEESGRR
ncbi:fused MFS/spermidine synthase [Wenzhouxiangella sp. AB-CW3]|uniref:fused MFS/spermidine synthase n=1 Tax=Wenzhouxiangella sp. AB-CW3 TaxID=2771012 RepID=UPI00168B13F9|nr:fused MFS/spermidine synthase [Wenzhouxiangella sp. AB-CW3]QOC22512.1 fused MFS/spermidine synthase [Wenzhouxiangella sp. AB-CW3]